MVSKKSKIIIGLIAVGLVAIWFFSVYSKNTPPIFEGTLGDAINNAEPGDTIYIPEGEYYENITINMLGKPLTIEGAGSDKTNLHFSDVCGILAQGCGTLTFKNLSMENNNSYYGAICLETRGTKTILSNVHFYSTPIGVALYNYCDESEITYCDFSDMEDDGILIYDSDDGLISHCNFQNSHSDIEFCIVDQLQNWNITNCTSSGISRLITVFKIENSILNTSPTGVSYSIQHGGTTITNSTLNAVKFYFITNDDTSHLYLHCDTGGYYSDNPERITVIPCE